MRYFLVLTIVDLNQPPFSSLGRKLRRRVLEMDPLCMSKNVQGVISLGKRLLVWPKEGS